MQIHTHVPGHCNAPHSCTTPLPCRRQRPRKKAVPISSVGDSDKTNCCFALHAVKGVSVWGRGTRHPLVSPSPLRSSACKLHKVNFGYFSGDGRSGNDGFHRTPIRPLPRTIKEHSIRFPLFESEVLPHRPPSRYTSLPSSIFTPRLLSPLIKDWNFMFTEEEAAIAEYHEAIQDDRTSNLS